MRRTDKAEGLLNGREYDIPSAPVRELAQQSGCTAYDCEFVHAARHLGVPLVTSDQRLLRAIPELAISFLDFAR